VTEGPGIRIDDSQGAGKVQLRPGETALLRYDLDFGGRPFLDDEGGGWISGDGPGWVLHYRLPDQGDTDEPRQEFFPGIPLVDTETARVAATEFLASLA
jgi:hypothetical protein